MVGLVLIATRVLNLTTIDKAGEEKESKPPPAFGPPAKQDESDEDEDKDDKPLARLDHTEIIQAIENKFGKVTAIQAGLHQDMLARFAALDSLSESLTTGEYQLLQWKKRQRNAARNVLKETIVRLITKEQKAALRESGKGPKPFFAWLDTFYEKHVVTMAETIRPAVHALLEVDGLGADAVDSAKEQAASYCAQSKTKLLSACECQPEEFSESIKACVADWKRLRADIIGEDQNGNSND